MSALNTLTALLSTSLYVGERSYPATAALSALDELIASGNGGGMIAIPKDVTQAAVERFWQSLEFESLNHARFVSYGLCEPSASAKRPIIEDRSRFLAVLSDRTGVDQWLGDPRWFRRCYQGLVSSFFLYDGNGDATPDVGKTNWHDLRDYLRERTANIVDAKTNPEWVTLASQSKHLFGSDPCEPYAHAVLEGDASEVDRVSQLLGISGSSWFLRELVLAQIKQATAYEFTKFSARMPRLLEILAKKDVLRDRGLSLVLDRYAAESGAPMNELLRDAAVGWWKNPWLPSNATQWGGVTQAAKEMVSEWLRREFIEAFFTKLAEDGVGDRRRANFWLRYVKSMSNVQFALGSTALSSRDQDYVALRKKMEGLYSPLLTNEKGNNAFIMTLGNLVAVEFGAAGNAFYGYDARESLPFDPSRPMVTGVNAENSLKHNQRILKIRHQDQIHGWTTWEKMFEDTLRERFNINPSASVGHVATSSIGSASSSSGSTPAGQGFSEDALRSFASRHNLKIVDRRIRNGQLWVMTGVSNSLVNQQLKHWGFSFREGKGWWL